MGQWSTAGPSGDASARRLSTARSWWGQEDHFEWVTAFLRSSGLLGSARTMMLVIAVSSGLVPLALVSSASDLGVGGAAIVAFSVVYFIVDTGFWATTRWPTRRQSAVLVLLGSVDLVCWTLVQPSPKLAALGCTAMAVTGGYIAFFHSVKLMAANFVLATVAAAVAAWRMAGDSVTVAVGSFWLIWLLVLAVPACFRATSRAMRAYLVNSHHDPLTGLLNRRGFAEAIGVALRAGGLDDCHLNVLLVDLDDFKRLNDTRGHAIGDQALMAVARLLQTLLPTAIICRAGGEEFLVAQPCELPTSTAARERLCEAIATLGYGVTASIGSFTTRVGPATTPADIDALVTTADAAMYVAKRNGGNQSHHISLFEDQS